MFIQNRKKALVAVFSVTLFAIILLKFKPNGFDDAHLDELHMPNFELINVADSACAGTLYPDLCIAAISTFPDPRRKALRDIVSSTINQTITEAKKSHVDTRKYKLKLISSRQLPDIRDRRAIEDCVELLDLTVTELESSLSDVLTTKRIPDAQALLSAAMTNLRTCLDGLSSSKKENIKNYMDTSLYNITRHVSNALAMVSKLPGAENPPSEFSHATSASFYGLTMDGFPRWMNEKDRKLLESDIGSIEVNLTVAQDGSGNFTTINEALAIAPNKSSTRFVIYIKNGTYYEYVEVVKKKMYIMFLGDGIGETLIKGNRSVGDGWTTFRSATLIVVGQGFIAKGITVENYAGAIKRQAVALRSGADLSAFYSCSFIGYQDTLYVHSLRQFYRECDVYGTVDFIFGNAAVVLQKCNLYAQRPLDNQKNMFTAQGRDDPNETTGISILESYIAPAADLIPVQASFKSYLGRPWKNCSRTVVMRSNITDLIDPAGWFEWDGREKLSTIYYGEYMNEGAGANTSGRVTWPGFRVITNETEAAQFTVGEFIQGGYWLNGTGIPYYLNLTA